MRDLYNGDMNTNLLNLIIKAAQRAGIDPNYWVKTFDIMEITLVPSLNPDMVFLDVQIIRPVIASYTFV